MLIEQLFQKPITRDIDPVIDATNESKLAKELEEYVITNEIANNLHNFLEEYTQQRAENGVWISGFFGSGKSHLLKILSAVLEKKEVDGQRADQIFIEKAKDHSMLKGKLDRASDIPSESILFNIDHNANNISKDETDAVLAVFMKMFNDHCGYFGNQPYIANFEYDLDISGHFQPFKTAFKSLTNREWETAREIPHVYNIQIDQAFNTVTGQNVSQILQQYYQTLSISIKDFASRVKAYIDKKDKEQKGFRLNFFVDELGQFIAERVNLMTNVQSIAETLKAQCNGRAWIIVTAQEDMQTVIGDYGRQQSDDFSKIQDRFKIRIKLKSSDVEEVIQKRLLEKTPLAIETLTRQYEMDKQDFNTLFSFTDGTRTYKNYTSADQYYKLYPFIPYQFKLFQSALKSLSDHNAFEGKHSSVGERPMLDVFRIVTIAIKDKDSKNIATFDRMFQGIRNKMKSSVQQSITDAEGNFGADSVEVRLLKTLLLVKYIREFKTDIDNITTLMIERFDQNKNQLKKDIQKVLDKLESETYIQKVGTTYEYLTDEEKDVESEIKNVVCTNDEINEEIKKILFTEILPDTKIKYEKTAQNIPITRKVDDYRYGQENGEIAINIITPMNENCGNIQSIKTLKMAENEMTLITAPDYELIKDLKLYLQTAQYSRQSRTESIKETRRKIIDSKIDQNQIRKKNIKLTLEERLSNATILVKSIEVNARGANPKERIRNCFQELIEQTYTNLKMLNQKVYDEEDIKQLLNEDMRFGLEAIQKEAQAEIISFMKNQIRGTRLNVKHIVDHFKKIPYGWGENDTAYILALLYKQNKVEFTAESNLLKDQELLEVLTTTRRKEYTVVKLLEDIPEWQKKKLTEFYKEYFNSPSHTDAKTLAIETKEKIIQKVQELTDLEVDASPYPFAQLLKQPIQHLRDIQNNEYTYFLTQIENYPDPLLEDKEDIIEPIHTFMKSNQAAIYREAKKFLEENKHNRDVISDSKMEEIQQILTDPYCFKGNRMQLLKSLIEQEQDKINAVLIEQRKNLKAKITRKHNQILKDDDYAMLTEPQKKELTDIFVQETEKVEHERGIANLLMSTEKLENTIYPEAVSKMRNFVYINNGKEPPTEPKYETIKITDLMNTLLGDNRIKDTDQLRRFIEHLKTELEEKIKAGKRIFIQ